MFQINKLLFLHNPSYQGKILAARNVSLTNQSKGKVWREDSLVILGYDGLKSPNKWTESSTVTHDFSWIPENPLI